MTATEFVSQTVLSEKSVSREELRAFYLTGRGLDRLRVTRGLMPAAPADLPPLESVFPVLLATGKAPQPRAGNTDAASGPLAGFHASALPLIYGGFLAAGRANARTRFLRELRQCVTDVQDLLAVDDAKLGSASPDRVAASLGSGAPRYLSVSRLMAVWARRAADKPLTMAPERRRRCETVLAVLQDAVHRHEDSPAFWLFRSDEDQAAELAAAGGREQRSLDPCADALAFCDRQLTEVAPVLRAMRVAKLEAVSAYDPAFHDEALERFDSQTADPWEIAALPVVIALQSAGRLSLNSFSQVLLAGRPVQVLIPWTLPDATGPDVADCGSIALMHRAAFVLQTSLARWDHLSKGFAEMAQAIAPSVAVVAIPTAEHDASVGWRKASLLARSQAFPLYRYDPDSEGEWADKFELRPADSPGLEALVVASRFVGDLRSIPPEAPNDGLMELSQYLRMQQAVPPFTIPFVNVTDEDGAPRRIVVTNAMVRLCGDRMRAWEMLTALAVRPRPTSDEITPPSDRAAIRESATKEAYMRVIALLANPENLVPRR